MNGGVGAIANGWERALNTLFTGIQSCTTPGYLVGDQYLKEYEEFKKQRDRWYYQQTNLQLSANVGTA
jgi:hypothetical protein